MPHKCVRCAEVYPDNAPEILKGCKCGCHYFFFFRDQDILEKQIQRLTPIEREEIMHDIEEVIPAVEKPVVLDLESIRILGSGKFEIDLVSLFKRHPIIYRLEEGKYFIDLASTFQLLEKEKKKE